MFTLVYSKFSTQLYNDPSSTQDQTHTLLSRYGEGDGLTTFNLPDYRECALIGVGTNGTNTIVAHDVYTVGQFKDDQMQGHNHSNRGQITAGNSDGKYKAEVTLDTKSANETTGNPITDGVNGTHRTGSTTHGKQIGINYIIKAL